MDPGAAAWSGWDCEFFGEEEIRNRLRARQPMLFMVRWPVQMQWENDSYYANDTKQKVEWHWLTLMGFWFDAEADEFWLGMRSGWRRGGSSVWTRNSGKNPDGMGCLWTLEHKYGKVIETGSLWQYYHAAWTSWYAAPSSAWQYSTH